MEKMQQNKYMQEESFSALHGIKGYIIINVDASDQLQCHYSDPSAIFKNLLS